MKTTWPQEDGYTVVTEPNPPYGIRGTLRNPKGKIMASRTFPMMEEEHWIAEIMYVRGMIESGKWKLVEHETTKRKKR